MTHSAIDQFSQLSGLLYFFAIFVVVLLYALRPSNRKAFERAARVPLDDHGDG